MKETIHIKILDPIKNIFMDEIKSSKNLPNPKCYLTT